MSPELSDRIKLPVEPSDIAAASERIKTYIRRTPIMQAALAAAPAARVFFKLEFTQHAGSFKSRGAFNNLLSCKVRPAGVTAASGGNHGIAVAQAAKRLGWSARIFVPEISAKVKVDAIRSTGCELIIGGARYADAQVSCDAYASESGALLVHPIDSVPTISGQGTLAKEWEEDQRALGWDKLDSVLVGVGGGGLIAGMAAWWRGRVKVVSVEPEGSRCLQAALHAGHPVDVPVESIAADSLGARRAGDLVFEIAKYAVADSILVTDAAIKQAQQLLLRDYRIISEPGGAAALGSLISGRYKPQQGERVGVLLCGGNVDPAKI
jgi:threonine dehydratase